MSIAEDQIRTRPNPDCHVCGAQGEPLYQRLRDRLFGVPGEWNLKKCPNPQCGLVWLDPMPIEEDIGKAYLTYFTHPTNEQQNIAYGKWGIFLRQLFKYLKHGFLATRYDYKNGVSIVQRILSYGVYAYPSLATAIRRGVRYVEYMPQGKLLDVGCGDGSYIRYMQELGWDVKGIDFDPEALSNARAKGLFVQLGDLAQQQFPENTFDVITVNHVIEHVPEPLGLLQESQRILKPGGMLMIATPNIASLGHQFFESGWVHLDPPRHLHIFTSSSLVTVVKKVGLQIIECRTLARSSSELLVSRSIRKTGLADLGGRHSLMLRVWANGMEVFEKLFILLKKNSGQEILLIATKENGYEKT
ncbi:MAG: class I SAM-dependent methyltransferase [Gammaproteobacteria bacterium]|nr:class I SAM-dependent methyltransferase [Gammaproteobacteria bacterium]